jgi:beta-glucosidase
MRMSRRFQPGVHDLETRITLSGSGTTAELVSQVSSATTIPSTVSVFYTQQAWLNFHTSFLAQAKPGAANVVFLGDSITYFWKAYGQADPTAAPTWARRLAPLGSADFGILGDETQNVLWRVEHGELAGQPRVAVLMVGLNNLYHGATAQQTYDGINAIVQEIHAQSPQTKVLLLGLLPTDEPSTVAIRTEIDQVNQKLEQNPPAGATTLAKVGRRFLNAQGAVRPGLLQPDHIHPTPRGYRLLTEEIRGPLIRLLASSSN